MYLKLDEEYYVENTFLKQLLGLGWKVYRQSKDDPEITNEIINFESDFEPKYGESFKFRESFSEIKLEEVLKESIKKINQWIEEDQINEVIRRLTTPQQNFLLEANEEIHDLLLENTSVSENRKTGERSPTVKFIDFRNFESNSFIAISQFKVNIPGTEKHVIPDIVLFVNGLPLVVIECKSPTIADPINEAITQLMRYSNRRGANEGNEKLFWFNLFMVATSNQKAKYGTITGDVEHFVEWKDPYPYALSDINSESNITSQQVLIQGMLSKNNLTDILHTFTIFKEDPKSGKIKVVARYQQFRAVKKIVKKLKEGKTPIEKGGIIWHTQGSGKSLTMVFTVREMYHNTEFGNFKIVFITDRKDLEKQLKDTVKSVGYTVQIANSIKKFKELLRTNTPDLVMGMIHKFQEREIKTKFPILNTSPNILIMIDEAHRSQYKLFGANLQNSLPNAVKIAFTGTPIDKTEFTFGGYIDKYGIKQSVEDGVTVDIIYEGRVHSAELKDEDAANAKFEDVFSMLDEEEKSRIMGRYTWQGYLEDKNVIRDKARDMINHYVAHIFPNGFKAQVVACSRLAAIRYREALEEALNNKIQELKKNNLKNTDIDLLSKTEVGVVISGSINDEPSYHPFTVPKEHEKIIKNFILPFNSIDNDGNKGNVGILVVQKMLITGFDAQIEQVMYLDNVIKGHNLLQAIARVNRVYKHKSCGFVVDYVGVLKHLKEALSVYADEDIQEISQVVKDKAKSIDGLRYSYNLINDFFKKYGIIDWRKDLDECIDILVDENIRDDFISLVRLFNKSMDAVLPDPEALKYITDLKIISFIKESARNRFRDDKLSIKDASKKIRDIVEEYLISEGVNPKIPPTLLLEDTFLNNIKTKKSYKIRAQELVYAIKEHITDNFEIDPELYERFSERLNRILEDYKENWELITQELENLTQDIKKGREGEETFGFDTKTEMPFLGVLKKEIFGDKSIQDLEEGDINFLVNLTKDIIEIVKREINVIDFWESYSKKKSLKSYIMSHLLVKKPKNSESQKNENKIKDKEELYTSNRNKIIFSKRNEIAQKILELSYNIYGK